MANSIARSAEPDSAHHRLSTLPSCEPDTSEVDGSWSEDAPPRYSFIALKGLPVAKAPASTSLRPPQAPSSAQQQPLAHDVWESSRALLILVDLPGVSPDHVALSLGSHSLFLEVTQPAMGVDACGLGAGRYELVIEAPDGLAPDAIDASLSNGLLRIRVSKEHAGARRLSIASHDPE